MNTIKLLDREFKISIPAAKIDQAIKDMAVEINKDLAGTNPLFVCILNGSFMFASDLMKEIKINI